MNRQEALRHLPNRLRRLFHRSQEITSDPRLEETEKLGQKIRLNFVVLRADKPGYIHIIPEQNQVQDFLPFAEKPLNR